MIPSGKDELQEGAVLSSPEIPEETLLKTVFGSPAAAREMKAQELVVSFAGGATANLATLAEKWIARHLPAAEIEEISTLASAVIGDNTKGTQWLSEPNVATGNRAPIDLIGEKDGYERVKSLLLRIEYGVLA